MANTNIRKACKFCGKVSDLESEIDLGSSGKMLVFACGHSYIEESLLASLRGEGEEKTNTVPSEGNTVKQDEIKETKSLIELLIEQIENPPYCPTHERNCVTAIKTHSGKHLFPYQAKGILAALKANAKFIFADEMGLGKTVQGLGTVLAKQDELLPLLFVCKSIAKTNMLLETMDILQIPAQVIESSSQTPFELFQVHIISYDLLNRLDKMFHFSDLKNTCDVCAGEGTRTQTKYQDSGLDAVIIERTTGREVQKTEIGPKEIKEKVTCEACHGRGYILFATNKDMTVRQRDENKEAWAKIIDRTKTIILDEVHLIKNPESQRSKAIKGLVRGIPHVLPMSGTLMKNSASEYFVPLNLVRPEKYFRPSQFNQNYVRYEYVKSAVGYSQKWTGLRNPEAFKEMTKDYMIRRTTDEVMPELPKLFKQQKYVEMDQRMKSLYEDSEKEFIDWYESASQKEIQLNLLAQLAILRHETSLAKVEFTCDLALEYLLSKSGKLAIFTHHIDSREFLAEKLTQFMKETDQHENTVKVLTQGKDVQTEIEEFKNNPNARILILSTLSHGESINLQFMSDSILHERQWNPANEDQAISGRFRRIGQESKSITCMIPVALGTIDEYLLELGERKGAIGKEIDTGKIESWNTGLVSELAEMIVRKGREKWRL